MVDNLITSLYQLWTRTLIFQLSLNTAISARPLLASFEILQFLLICKCLRKTSVVGIKDTYFFPTPMSKFIYSEKTAKCRKNISISLTKFFGLLKISELYRKWVKFLIFLECSSRKANLVQTLMNVLTNKHFKNRSNLALVFMNWFIPLSKYYNDMTFEYEIFINMKSTNLFFCGLNPVLKYDTVFPRIGSSLE